MAKLVEFTTNFDDFDTFKEFQKDLRKEVIETGLDSVLSKSLIELRTNLKFIINERVTSAPEQIDGTNVRSQTVNELNQSFVSIPKSEEELVKFLTKGKADPSKYNKAKDYTTLSETGMVFGHKNRGGDSSNRVTLRMEIGPDETVESQFNKARAFFESAVFAFPQPGGKFGYFVNPGIDISQFVKIKCSTLTGFGDADPFEGMSPAQRFQRDTHTKGYAEWTLKQDAVNAIRKSFLNITDVIDLLKDGDYDRAKQVIDRIDKNNKLGEFKEQIDKLEARKDLPSTTQGYTNAIKLINNLRISKKISQEDVVYNLISDYDDFSAQQEGVDFFAYVLRAIRSWVAEKEDEWFNTLVKDVERLIKKYESQE